MITRRALWMTPLILWSAGARATTRWRVDPASSRLQFSFQENGQLKTGQFTRFGGDGIFDATRPGASALTLIIDVGSVDLGDILRNGFVRSAEWFDVEQYPQARFVLTKLLPVEGDFWVAEGLLTLKGVTRPLALPLTLQIRDNQAQAEAELLIERRQFNIGGGPSERVITIGPQIIVTAQLTANREG